MKKEKENQKKSLIENSKRSTKGNGNSESSQYSNILIENNPSIKNTAREHEILDDKQEEPKESVKPVINQVELIQPKQEKLNTNKV